MSQAEYVWVIAHIDRKQINRLQKDLNKSNQYIGMEAQVPTVQVLKKQFKNKDFFDSIPLLFNYGFFKVPLLWALNDDLLDKIKKDITCISSWVRDRAKAHSTKAKYEFDEDGNYIKKYLTYKDVSVATVTELEVMRLVKFAHEESIHSSDEVDSLQVGSIVKLMGYPFEGIDAEILEIKKKQKKLLVKLMMDEELLTTMSNTKVEVHFDSVFWSIYKGSYDEDYGSMKSMKEYQVAKNKPEDDESTQ